MVPLQPVLMAFAGCACLVSALDWTVKGSYASAVAFTAFGIGYFALAVAFRSTP